MTVDLPGLSKLEREVMQLIWAQGSITAEIVRERLTRSLKESTVRTVLHRLEEKGYVNHTVDGRTYVFRATEARQRVAANAIQRIAEWFCNGSVEEMLVGMVDSKMLGDKEFQALANKISRAKEKSK